MLPLQIGLQVLSRPLPKEQSMWLLQCAVPFLVILNRASGSPAGTDDGGDLIDYGEFTVPDWSML